MVNYAARAFGTLAADIYGQRRGITCQSEQAWLTLAFIAIAADMLRERKDGLLNAQG